MTNFDCKKCLTVYGKTDGEVLKLPLQNGVEATIWKEFKFRCKCGFLVKWHENRNMLLKTTK